jgi:hypothetical protein
MLVTLMAEVGGAFPAHEGKISLRTAPPSHAAL